MNTCPYNFAQISLDRKFFENIWKYIDKLNSKNNFQSNIFQNIALFWK